MDEQLLTTTKVSKILHVGKSTIKRWTEEGKLQCFRTPGGHRKFTLQNIQRFVSEYHYQIDISE